MKWIKATSQNLPESGYYHWREPIIDGFDPDQKWTGYFKWFDKSSGQRWAIARHREWLDESESPAPEPVGKTEPMNLTKDRIEFMRKEAEACEALTIGFMPEQFEGREAHWRAIEAIRSLSHSVQVLTNNHPSAPSGQEPGDRKWGDAVKQMNGASYRHGDWYHVPAYAMHDLFKIAGIEPHKSLD